VSSGARLGLSLAVLTAGVVSTSCNAVLGIEEPIEGTGSGGAHVTVVAGGSAGGSGATTTMPAPKDGGQPANGALEWAQWPMPNPASAGLPNAQSYDTTSFGGVVLDLITGLQWQQAVDENSHTWDGASTYCSDLTLGGGGWRLPTRIELISLLDYTSPNPVIDMDAFPETPADYFWTSSAYAGDAMSAWNVNFKFSDGMADKSEMSKAHRVRCVR
jgi:Protein of unknown function (DUF1566)